MPFFRPAPPFAALLLGTFLALPSPAPASLSREVSPAAQARPPAPESPAASAPPGTGSGIMDAAAGKSGSGAARRETIRSLARRGHFDSALALCRQALESDSGDGFARFMAGKLSLAGKASAEHFLGVLESGKTGPEAEESRFRLGQFHYAAGKYHLAIPCFREYIRLHPRGDWQEPALYWMGRACLALAQSRADRAAYLDSGLVYFQRLRDLEPPDRYYHALALEGIAKTRLAQGDREGARQAAQGALDKAPEDERAAILLLAAQLRRDVDREEERRLLRKLAEEHPLSPEVRHLRRLNGSPDPSRWRAPAPPGPLLPPDSARTRPQAPAGVPSTLPPSVAAPAGAPPRYTLQLGAFAQAANARSLMAEVAKLGFAPELSEASRGGKAIYQVRLGRFATAEEAQAFAGANLKPRKILFQAVPLD